MVMARIWALAGLLVVLVAASPASGKVEAVYALRYGAKVNVLVPYDPVRLAPSGPPIPIGRFGQAWSISPDRSRFVAAAGWHRTPGEPAAVRFVDLANGTVEGTVSLRGELGRIMATAWTRGRVLIVVSGSRSTTVHAIDPERRLTISQVTFPGVVVAGERAPSRLILLLASPDRIGPATIAVVDQALRVRTVVLERIAVGATATGIGADHRVTMRRPALVVGGYGLRAFAFGSDHEPAASIDLRTMTVRYRIVRQTAAVNKRAEGSVRTAAALPDGRIVVGGFDYDPSGTGETAGLWLVDPRDWSRRLLDRTGAWFRVASGLVFARGKGGVGLRILHPIRSRADLFRTGSVANVTAVGPRALVTFFGARTRAAVIEPGSGRVVRHTGPAHLLVEAGQPIVG
jgi:hypothetical protein